MAERCLQVESLGGVLAAPADDPRRLHLEQCPRCRARLAAYLEFMAPTESPARDELAGARARLEAALAAETGADAGPVAGDRDRPGFWHGLLRWMTRPALRPVWGAAAALLIVLVAREMRPPEPSGPAAPRLRGEPTAAGEAIAADDPVRAATGALSFTWRPVATADEYRLILYGPDLAERAQHSATQRDRLTLPAEALPAGDAGAGGGFWRIRAYHAGDAIAESALRPLPTSP
jgi:hypothetical protein